MEMLRTRHCTYSGIFLAAITVCSAFPAFNSTGRQPSPCNVASNAIDLRQASSNVQGDPLLMLDISSTNPLSESTLAALQGYQVSLVTPSSYLESNPALFREAARAGHTIILAQGPSSEHAAAALFESFLGFAPIFANGAKNISGTLRVVGTDQASHVLRNSAALNWAAKKLANEMGNGIVGRMTSSQLACVHSRMNCDFVTPGEILWRFCKTVRSEYKHQIGTALGSYALRRDGVGDSEEMKGFLGRNRRRVALAQNLAKHRVDQAMFVLYGMNDREAARLVRKEESIVGWHWIQCVRFSVGGFWLIAGTYGMALRIRKRVIRYAWKWLMAKAADFGKIV
eukprot:GFKZ01009662.1.p2 GENE.GFKZ01009662.1~~GFKZ01009662.1.p2  ORF type:complete len:341 (-),score=37.34 GFKZ01009662.1:3-1025(-)